ncbi:Acyl-CoA N-acyltransferase (NAT) superfamily protein [Forsythia ovata]|uniref:Acyl-CoA N-acyltransferase (NAT) superfamily protein n=1 Tax=Forsythia ovata TaxID=205694 RepID=A0ABD1WDL6_9LAMI
MATTVSLSISLDTQPHHRRRHQPHHLCNTTIHFSSHQSPFFTPKHRHPQHPSIKFPKHPHHNFTLSLSPSSSTSTSSSTLQNPLRTGRFLTNEELEKLENLEKYNYHQELQSGLLLVRVMREEEMDMTVTLLAESFAESMMMAKGYVKLLEFLVRNYLIERRAMMPHSATLLGIYRENGEEDFELAGTVEVCFDKRGANTNPPTPTPPKNSPYICNMAVRRPLRRRGIGWHLLKAGEELISQMSSSREVYLHCRVIDEAPFNMYTKAGYSIVKTDSLLTLLTFQRRRHLMRKEFPIPNYASEMDNPDE